MVKWSKTIQVQFTHAEMVNLNIPPWAPIFGAHKGFQWFLAPLVHFHTFRSGATPSLTHSHMLIPRTGIAAVSVCSDLSAHWCMVGHLSLWGKPFGLQFSRAGSIRTAKRPGVNVSLGCRRL